MSQIELEPAHHTSLLQRVAAPPPVGARLVCQPGQAAVFAVAARVVGALGPGHHVLDPRFIAFVGPALQQRPLGPVVGEDLYFAKLGSTVSVSFGGALSPRYDPMLGERVVPRFAVTLELGLADPARAVTLFHGKATGGAEQEARARAEPIVARELEKLTLVTELIPPERWREASAAAEALLRPELAASGLSLVGLVVSGVELPDHVAARLRSSAATATHPGTEVAPVPLELGARVRTRHEGRWHSGRVVAVSESSLEVEWDGTMQKTWVPRVALEPEPRYPGAHAPGTRLLAQRADGGYWPATVRAFNGTSYEVGWDDGASAWLSPGQVRTS